MGLLQNIKSEENIYLSIYRLKSYVSEYKLLSEEKDTKNNKNDKNYFIELNDYLNFDFQKDYIKKVQERLDEVLKEDDKLFECKVYFRPKKFDAETTKIKFRHLHSAPLVDLVAMVSILNVIVYEFDNNKIKLSSLSEQIPDNFYGNKVSTQAEYLFVDYRQQYKKYIRRANKNYKKFSDSKKYKYEVKLDFKNFFPSIDPAVIYNIVLKNISQFYSKDDIDILKKCLFKLLVLEITNLNNDEVKKEYYGDIYESINDTTYTLGIPQGLPQSNFFSNIYMLEVKSILEKHFNGEMIFYVDDVFIYTNCNITEEQQFKEKISEINNDISEEIGTFYKNKIKYDNLSKVTKKNFLFFNKEIYKVLIYDEINQKSFCNEIKNKDSIEYMFNFMDREISKITFGINRTYSYEEDEIIYKKLKATKELIENLEYKLEKEKQINNYKDKIIKIKKYIDYRIIKIELRKLSINNADGENDEIRRNLFSNLKDVLFPENKKDNIKNYDDLVDKLLNYEFSDKKNFMEVYKNGIWEIVIQILKQNGNSDRIKKYISNISKMVYKDISSDPDHQKINDCNYINTYIYEDFDYQKIENEKYTTIREKVSSRITFNNLSGFYSAEEKLVENIRKEKNDVFSFIFTENYNEYNKIMSIVNSNSSELYRIYLNAIYSHLYQVCINDSSTLISTSKFPISYSILRTLVYLRNKNFEYIKFVQHLNILNLDDNIDYGILEVVPLFLKFVKEPEMIDNLILIHKYTCELWRNGSKHLYFYTLHNQEHAVVLIKNIIKLTKILDCLKVSYYDFYLLFASCYLHDISMTTLVEDEDFLNDIQTDKIVSDFINNFNNDDYSLKKELLKVYKNIDEYCENKIRSNHAEDSKSYILNDSDLFFIDDLVRKNIADISSSHGKKLIDVYRVKSDSSQNIHLKNDRILLRLADLLDITAFRVSKLLLEKNIDNMPKESAFHWVSHLLTTGFRIDNKISEVDLKLNQDIVIVIKTKFNNCSATKMGKCKNCELTEINKEEININISNNNIEKKYNSAKCKNKCNLLCKWFVIKNEYLINELSELSQYLNYLLTNSIFSKVFISIKLEIDNQANIPNKYLQIIQDKINSLNND